MIINGLPNIQKCDRCLQFDDSTYLVLEDGSPCPRLVHPLSEGRCIYVPEEEDGFDPANATWGDA